MKIIAISGGSGSGKTTLAKKLKDKYNNNSLLISLDNYYINQETQILNNGFCNFDHPLSLDKELLLKNLNELNNNKKTKIPIYCFKKRDRIGYTEIYKKEYVLVEGLYAIEFLKNISHKSIFIYSDDDIMLARRISRDIKNRNRDLNSILMQYFEFVKPAYSQFILEQNRMASTVIENNYQNIEDFIHKIEELNNLG